MTTAASAVQRAATTVRNEARSVSTQVDSFAGTVHRQAQATSAQLAASPRPWYSGVTDALEHTDRAVLGTVASTVNNVQSSVEHASRAVSDAGRAVEAAGSQVVDSGRRVVQAADRAGADVRQIAQDAGRLINDAGQVVTSAGQAAYHAGSAALTGNPRELEAAQSAISRARGGVDDAQRAVSDAHSRVADLGAQGQEVRSALVDARTSLENAGRQLGGASRAVSEAVHQVQRAPAQIANGIAAAVERGGQEAREAIARDVPGGRQMLDGVERYVRGTGQVALGVATGNPLGVANGVREQSAGVAGFSDGAFRATAPAVDYAIRAGTEYANGFNVDRQIGDLRPGESYEVRVGANVHVEVGGEAQGNLRVTANRAGGYTVNAGGQLGINGYLHGGGRVNLGVVNGSMGGELSAHIQAGGNLELRCANAGEAQRAAQILERISMAGSPAGLLLHGPNPVSGDDAEFLRAHTSGLELTGNVAREAMGALGLDRGVLRAGVGGTATLDTSSTLRIEMDHGRATGVTVRSELRGELEAHGGLGLQLPRGNGPTRGATDPRQYNVTRSGPNGRPGPNGAPPENPLANPVGAPSPGGALMLSGRLEGRLVAESHFDLPQGVSGEAFQRDPMGALRQYGQQMQQSEQLTLRASLSGRGRAGSAQANREVEVALTGRPAEILTPDVLQRAWNGDYAGAARAAGEHTEVEGRIVDFRERSWGGRDVGGDILGVGVSGTFQATRRVDDPPLVEFRGNGTEFVENLSDALGTFRSRPAIVG